SYGSASIPAQARFCSPARQFASQKPLHACIKRHPCWAKTTRPSNNTQLAKQKRGWSVEYRNGSVMVLCSFSYEVTLENSAQSHDEISRKLRVLAGYRTALNYYKSRKGLARISWVTWIVTLGTIVTWCYTADQIALASGAHSLRDVITNILANAINIQQ